MKVCGQQGRTRVVAPRSRIASAVERHLHSVIALGSLFGAAAAPAVAATWVGNTSGDWGTNTNWVGNALPAASDTLVFNAPGTAGLSLTDNLMTPGTNTVTSVSFGATAGAYVINSATPGTNGFTLTGNITNSSTSLQTLNDVIVTTAQRTVTMTAGGGNVTLGGNISGTGGGLLLAGSGTLTLSGTNAFTGTIITNNGDTNVNVGVRVANGTTLAIGSNTALGSATYLDLGPGTGTIMAVGGARTVANGLYTLNANGTIAGSNDLTFNGQLLYGGANTIFVNNTGLTTFAGGVQIRQTGTGTRTITLAGTGNTLINSVIANGSTTTGSLTYAGTGTLTLAPGSSNTYNGATLISSGTLQLDFSQTALATNIIATTSALQLGGGTLAIKGDTGETDAQTFASTTFNTGTASAITVNQNGAAAVNLTLNGMTRNAGSVVNFVLPTLGGISSTTTTSTGTNKINGNGVAYSTVSSDTWLVNNAGALSALGAGSYNTDAYTASLDTDITVDGTPGQFAVNTLRFSVASKTLTLNSAGPSTVTSGGILVTSAASNSIIASDGGSAALTAGATGKEIVVHNYGGLTINAPITDGNSSGIGLTLAGTGTTVLNAVNTYTGATRVTSGTTSLAGSLTNTAITVYTAGTLSQAGSAAIGGTSSLAVSGGTVNLGGTNTYSGTTNVSSGRLNINSTSALGTGQLTTGGTIDATNGAIASQTNNPVIALGSFTFGGTNSLTLGTGLVSSGGDPTITLAGNNNNTITFGGTFSNSAATAKTLTVNNAAGVSGEAVVFNNGFNLATAGTGIQYVLAGTGNIVINGTVANGSGSSNNGIIKNGTGALTLNGGNAFTGAVNWNGGTLNVNNASAISGTSFVINSGTAGVLNNTSAGTVTAAFNPTVTWSTGFGYGGSNSLHMGNGTVSISGDRTVTLLGNNSNTLTFGGLLQGTQLSGAFTLTVNNAAGVSGETLVFNNGFNMQAAAGAGGGNFILSGSGRLTINGGIANGSVAANNLAYTGTGTLTLGGTSTYTGNTSISGNGGTVVLNGTLGSAGGTTISVTNNASLTQAVGGAIAGTSSINNNGGNTTLAGTNTYSGTTALAAGRLNVNSNNALGSGNTTISGGTIDNTGVSAVTGQANNPSFTLGGSFIFGGTNNLDLGTGTVNNAGDRTITLNGNNTSLTFGGTLNNTNAGAAFNITVNNGVGFSGGSVVFNNGYNIAAAADLASRVGILSGSGKIVVNGAVANGNGLAQSLTYVGTGNGSLTLGGTSTYTGATLVTGGTLLVNGATDIASTVTVNATAAIGGSGTVNGTLNANGTITPGSAGIGTAGTLTAAGNATLGDNGILTFDLNTADVAGGTGGNDLLSVVGNLTVGANEVLAVTPGIGFTTGTYQLIDYAGSLTINGGADLSGWTLTGVSADYTFGYGGSDNGVNSIFLTVNAVPEPASVGLLHRGGRRAAAASASDEPLTAWSRG